MMLSSTMLFLIMMLPGVAVLLTSFIVSLIERKPNSLAQELVNDGIG